jgi:hypothetical protein
MQVERITPEPERTEIGKDGMVYVFPIHSPGVPTVLTFHLQHQEVGSHEGWLGLQGGDSVRIDQFTYP